MDGVADDGNRCCAVQVDEGRMPGNFNERLQSGVGGAPRSVRSGVGTLKCLKTCAEHARAHSWSYKSGVVFKGSASRRRGEVSPRFQESFAEETQVPQHSQPWLQLHIRKYSYKIAGVSREGCVHL